MVLVFMYNFEFTTLSTQKHCYPFIFGGILTIAQHFNENWLTILIWDIFLFSSSLSSLCVIYPRGKWIQNPKSNFFLSLSSLCGNTLLEQIQMNLGYFLFLKGMTGALAPASYLVVNSFNV